MGGIRIWTDMFVPDKYTDRKVTVWGRKYL